MILERHKRRKSNLQRTRPIGARTRRSNRQYRGFRREYERLCAPGGAATARSQLVQGQNPKEKANLCRYRCFHFGCDHYNYYLENFIRIGFCLPGKISVKVIDGLDHQIF